MTLLCVPIMVRDIDAAIADAAEAKSLGADIVEFRIDEYFDGGHNQADPGRQTREILRLVHQSVLPAIVTCRSASEGGAFEGDETDRLALYERLGTSAGKNETPPRYLDIELAAYTKSESIQQKLNIAVEHPDQLRAVSTGLILSMHDFQQRPADLVRRLLLARQQPAAKVMKIAFRARSLRDNLELFEILAHRDRPTIALGMGEFGLMSRVLAPKFGGFLTFASLRPSAGTAPGQPTIEELLNLYRFRAIKPTTKVYGVIGWPVGHSLSPLVHNAMFDSHGFDGVYLPLPISGGQSDQPGQDASEQAEASYASFKATLGALLDEHSLDFAGASVTIPHKENLVRFALDRLKAEPGVWSLDAASLVCGAANSLSIERSSGKITRARVFNTDIPAAVGPLRSALGSLENKEIAVVGAGGVARGIAFGLASEGVLVTVFNRNLKRAEAAVAALAARAPTPLRLRAAPLDDLSRASGFAAFINCTPVGMAGGPDPAGMAIPVIQLGQSAADGRNNRAPCVVLETVYNPVQTPLVRAALDVGWTVIDGVTMFVEQAALQSEAWTGAPASRDVLDRLVRNRLSMVPKV